MRIERILGAVSLAFIVPAALSIELSNGPGDGSVTVGVDAFGSFGSSIGGAGTSNAFFDPVGSIGSSGTTFESGIAVSFGGSRPYLTSGSISGAAAPATNVVIGNQTATSLESSFTLGSLDFALSQSLTDSLENGTRFGSILNQVYTITNRADVPNSFDVVRYIDGDLSFDGTISDGGGRIFQSGNEILFETDAGVNADDTTTFVGITGVGGTAPDSNRFEISSFSGLRNRIATGSSLTDTIEGDTDNDGFIEDAFDVTMALRNEFALGPGESATYTTQTLFGNAVPPAPGSIEALPLLPTEIDPDGAFIFNIDSSSVEDGQIFFIDPDIAIGYTYAVTGASFASVQAPSLAAVPDADGYMLEFSFDGVDFNVPIGAGELVTFSDFDVDGIPVSGLEFFQIQGIDPDLALDPTDPLAYVTGVAVTGITGETFQIAQTPIVESIQDNGGGEVPVPPTILLLGAAFAGLVLRRRRSVA